MPAIGKHRRRKSRLLSRGFVAASAGGAAVILPVLGATTAGAVAKSAPAAAPEKAAVQAAAKKSASATYSVVKGDTLAKIARTHSISGGWKKLYEDNRSAVGDNPGLIHPGLKLSLDGKGEAPKKAAQTTAKQAAAVKTVGYADNLDGWIRESLDVMAKHGIPGSYDGIHRNIMRESAGNPLAVNNWDINAVNGTPSKGLLQVIQPTFDAYHVEGTSTNMLDPVANITAACNYAADRYGSIDNVNGPY